MTSVSVGETIKSFAGIAYWTKKTTTTTTKKLTETLNLKLATIFKLDQTAV